MQFAIGSNLREIQQEEEIIFFDDVKDFEPIGQQNQDEIDITFNAFVDMKKEEGNGNEEKAQVVQEDDAVEEEVEDVEMEDL